MTADARYGRRYLRRLGVEEARSIFLERVSPGGSPAERIPTAGAEGRVTAGAVDARQPAPFYHSSAMDGLAVESRATFGASEVRPAVFSVPGDGVWVDTGDPIPPGKDAVVMSEELHYREDGTVAVHGAAAPWDHVRVTGEEIASGEMVLPAGWRIRPPDIGALLAAGVTEIEAAPRPRVLIHPTGSEMIRPGEPLVEGAVVEFNSEVVASLVREAGGEARVGGIVPDDEAALRRVLREGARSADAVVILAGSSAGTEDFTPRSIEAEGELLAHGINIAPGKPTALGVVSGTPAIGLPGFPVAALISARLFLLPLLRRLQGLPEAVPHTMRAVLPRALPSRPDVREFIRVRLGRVGETVWAFPLPRGSAAILSFVRARGLVVIPEGSEGLPAGTEVSVELLGEAPDLERTVVLSGSHDLLLDVLEDELRGRGVHLITSAVGSLGGILALRDGTAQVATSHLLDPETGEYNTAYIRRYLPGAAVERVGVVLRRQGLIVAPGNPKGLASWKDLGAPGVRFVNRQKGSGSRVLLDCRLGEAGVDPASITGYGQEEYTHWAVAMAVKSGRADTGLGIHSAAATMGLDFVPLEEEEFDLLVPEAHGGHSGVRALLQTLGSPRFRERVTALGGYRFR